ncbi:MurR/RpiR family transcriptional regulator [Eubacterium sp. AF36-5BH]|jgi:DNA-binding MurR/RpiR family transcriptional regulator|uniref:MurR/RpiR family transcriptional regulator n=1 Tax=Eubacterium sp. AF36-5BH TaxID=2293108 RepID=UPI000E51EE88|nr:MurR/RpiR family transcriptional regulator [Eubacterium sp. AF36-5BH]RGF48691.1 MurR/RpiR family transcriptional regulator [Eubacterium sp. AF36-5BH]
MEKSVINQICASMDTFFETEKKIGNFIIHHPKEIVDMTVGELAKECQVSEASVSRFCKKIDMKGFHHLKISIAKEMVSQSEDDELSNHISVDDLEQSLKNILANKVAELTQTVSMMNSENLQDILKRINNAHNVLFAAVGNTVPVAMDGAYKLNQIGISAVSTPVWETQLAYSYNLSPDDVVIAISNSGESTGVINILEAAKQKKATTISITNSEKSTIAKISDYHITTATREKLFLDEYRFSRVSATMVIEVLYLFLTSMRKEAYDSIIQHESSIAFTKE